MQTKIQTALEAVLKQFGATYYIDDTVNKAKVIDDLDRYDEDLINAFLENETLKKHYSRQIGDYTVVETNKLIETFEMDDYWMDSHTKYSKKIGLTLNGRFLDEATEVVLDFPYKDTVLKAGMTKEDVEKDEPFYNEIIAANEIDIMLDKKILINAKRYSKYRIEDALNFSDEDNLIIKGNNLLGLYTLNNIYKNKVKSIFIDPPYYFNLTKPSDTFSYNSNFKLSSWLTFMKNRLDIAYELMTENGVIFISISDEGAHYLKVLVDQIFGNENFIADVTWESRTSMQSDGLFSPNSNHILVYAKNTAVISKNDFRLALDIESFKFEDKKGKYRIEPFDAPGVRKNLEYGIKNPNTGETYYPPKGRHWRTTEETYKIYLENNYIQFGKTGESKPQLKAYYSEVKDSGKGKAASTIWHNVTNSIGWFETNTNTSATKHQREVFGEDVFTNPKPEELIKRALELSTDENDLVLDFFMGSATTQAVAMKMNRRFIGIEQMDYINTVSVPRLQKVIEGEQGGISKDVEWQGGGSFVYAELMEKSQGYIHSVQSADSSTELKNVYQLMLDNVSLDFRADLEAVQELLEDNISLDDKKRVLLKVIDKNQLYYNLSEINDGSVRPLISDSDYAFNQAFYGECDIDE